MYDAGRWRSATLDSSRQRTAHPSRRRRCRAATETTPAGITVSTALHQPLDPPRRPSRRGRKRARSPRVDELSSSLLEKGPTTPHLRRRVRASARSQPLPCNHPVGPPGRGRSRARSRRVEQLSASMLGKGPTSTMLRRRTRASARSQPLPCNHPVGPPGRGRNRARSPRVDELSSFMLEKGPPPPTGTGPGTGTHTHTRTTQ